MARIKQKFIIFSTATDGVNARVIPANYTPAAYTPVAAGVEATTQISAHLKGINNALAAISPDSVVAVSSNISLADKTVYLVNTSAARSLTLPTPVSGLKITVKDVTGSANVNNITIVRAGSETIEGVAASWTIDQIYLSTTFISDGTNWWII